MKNLLINRALAAGTKKLFILLFALVASVSAIYASDTQVAGIWYDFDESNKTATVTYRGSSYNSYTNEYSFRVVIPSSVTYNGTTYSVTSIGDRAFYDCSLWDVTIPNSVTSIGDRAFYKCSSLTSVTIPNSVTSIGDYAFYNCSSLTSMTIGNSVTSIGESAFTGCSSLTSMTIGNSVTSIGESAFTGCSSLTSINVDAYNSKYSSADGVLFNKDKTTLIAYPGGKQSAYTIPNSVTSIGDRAFYDCSSLTSVTIPNSVTSIGYRAFDGCSSLTSVTIPNSVTSIGEYAFYYCSSLTSVTIGNSVTSIGGYAFYLCSSLTSVTIGNSVTSIGDYAFYNCSSLTSVTIGNSVTSIGKEAFYNCDSLTSVTIPNSVTSIGKEAFQYCDSLTSVTIPNSVTSIGGGAFEGCSSLTSVTLTASSEEDFCKGQGNSLLYTAGVVGCRREIQINGNKVTDFTIPNSVTSIGDYAFYYCSSLTSVTIPNSVTSIGEDAFYLCSSLTSVTIPNSVTSIGEYAFYYCSSLTSMTIGNSVTSIGDYAFRYCSKLTSVTIGNSVTSIGNSAFLECSSLTSVTLTASSEEDFCKGQGNSLLYTARVRCRREIQINGNKVTDFTIPNSVTSIGGSAFYGCSSLTSITCEAMTPPTIGNTGTFDGVSTSIPVYVPCGCIEAYKAANGWENFTNIQGPLAEYSITVDVNDTIMGSAKVDINNACGAQISAKPNIGYHFVQWNDGNTENPRTLELTQDTTLTADFTQSFSGQCGNSLYWELVDTTLQITGKGKMYDYKSNSAPWKLLVSSIKSLTIAEDVTKLSQSFDSCFVLESIIWNAKYAADAYNDGQYIYPIFYEIRSQIKSFTFGENVEYIPTYLCYGMEKLTSVTIPNSVTSIGDYAFYECSSLTSVTIPNSVTSIGDYAFHGCKNITSVTWNAKNCNTYNFGSQVISFEFGNEVEVVPSSLCQGMTKLTSITIPNSVTSIGGYAFQGCSSLTSITIPNSVTSIGESAFTGCSSLTSMTIGNSVTSIGEGAFYGCKNITSVTWNAKNCNSYNFGSQVTSFEFGNEVEVVPSSLCQGMTKLTSITIPNSVNSIRENAFQGCSSLTSITIPNSVTSIGSSAFDGCSSLTSVTIGNSVTSIGENAFQGCSSLTSITIPNSVTSIGSSAFDGCSSLTSVTIGNSVTSIGEGAFYGCKNITSVTWNAKNCNSYNFGSQVTSFEFGNEVEVVPSSLCKGMEKLTSVTFPNSVKTIGTSAFEGCVRLGEISLGNGLENIGDSAFAECTRLYDIYVYATYPPFAEESSFANYNVYVYIPCEYQRDYTLDVVWGKFKFIECISSDNVTTDEIVVTPSENEANVIWPSVSGAASYELVIKDKSGNIVCTLIFNANGQLTSIAFNAPSRNGVPAQTQNAGFSFTITGLDSGTGYDLTLTAKDNSGNAIQTETISFVTTGGNVSTDIDQLQGQKVQSTKVVKDGQVLILRGEKVYTIDGRKVH